VDALIDTPLTYDRYAKQKIYSPCLACAQSGMVSLHFFASSQKLTGAQRLVMLCEWRSALSPISDDSRTPHKL